MSTRNGMHSRRLRRALRWMTVILLALPTLTWAGHQFRNNSVGGVAIDVEGVVGPAREAAKKLALAELRKEIKEASPELAKPVALRMVSLRGLAETAEKALREDFGRLPDEVRFLAGLQRIQYVFVYPEKNDIVLAGPGEGWVVNDDANVVGVTSGRPVIRLDDLLVALRYVEQARTDGISCSIDPTEEGNRALAEVLERQRQQPRVNPTLLEASIKRAYGPQQITVTGIPPTSHTARILVAADYQMKRIAMKIDESPVRGIPSYLDLIKSSQVTAKVNPRWWMACNYEPLATADDGLAWELRGPGVKVMTEDEFITAAGEVRETGRRSAPAQRWADLMTEHYDSLSVENAVFGELRNIMDLCVVAALMQKENLLEKAGCSVPILTDADSPLKLETWNAPRRVAPEVSFLRTRGSWIVTASGGVQVESWRVAGNAQSDASVGEVRMKASAGAGQNVWWQ